MRLFVLAALLVPVLGCGGRHTENKPAPVADAGAADAAVAAAPIPFTGRIVARSLESNIHLVPMQNDGLVLASGPAMWRVATGGSLERIGTPADAIPLLAAGDDELGGYDARLFDLDGSMISGTAAAPFVTPVAGTSFQWTNNKEWSKVVNAPAAETRSPWRQPTLDAALLHDLPNGYDWTQRKVTSNRVVVLGDKQVIGDARKIDEAIIAPTPGHPAKVIDFPAEHATATKYRYCNFIESADDNVYLACTSSANLQSDWKHSNYILDGDHWSLLTWDPVDSGMQVFDSEGALWRIGGAGGPWSLSRITRDGKEERLEQPAAPADLNAPSYRSEDIPLVASGAHAELRHWIATTISMPSTAPDAHGWIYDIIPRRSGEVWVLTRDSAGVNVVRFARTESGPAPVLIRSAADERSTVQAARGVRNWGGNCNSVFLPFPHNAVPAAFYDIHAAEIEQLVATTDPKNHDIVPLDVSVVEGRLDGHKVGGLVFIQADPTVDDKRFVKAIQKLSELATPDPASPPNVTCTLPELDKVIKQVRVGAPQRY